MTTLFDKEIAVFEAHKAEWLREHEGEFVLIKGDRVLGFFPTHHAAYIHGIKTLGRVAMLVEPVTNVREHALLLSPTITLADGG